MTPRRITLAILLAALALTGVFVVAKWRAAGSFLEPKSLLSRFPVEDAAVVSIDAATLRRNGFFAQSKSPLEPEYRAFVEGSGFDYKRDLDSVTATFGPSGNYFIARGRFHWEQLRAYARKQGGSCYEQLCRMPGSTPERRISFLPLRDDVIAIGVSTDDLAATRLTTPGKSLDAAIPAGPAWMLIPGSALRRANSLPAGLRLMLSALTRADRVVLSANASGGGVALNMQADCRSSQDADMLLSQLKTTTATLVEVAKGSKDAEPDALLTVLTSGVFRLEDKQVTGRWPVPRTMFNSLTEGI